MGKSLHTAINKKGNSNNKAVDRGGSLVVIAKIILGGFLFPRIIFLYSFKLGLVVMLLAVVVVVAVVVGE